MAYRRKLEKDIRCPLEYGLDVIGGKWSSRVICVLADKGTLRYSELRDAMADISDAVMANTLKKLMGEDIVQRVQYNEMPLRVEYSLTQRGKSALPILQSICQWAGIMRKDVGEPSLPHCAYCDFKPEL